MGRIAVFEIMELVFAAGIVYLIWRLLCLVYKKEKQIMDKMEEKK